MSAKPKAAQGAKTSRILAAAMTLAMGGANVQAGRGMQSPATDEPVATFAQGPVVKARTYQLGILFDQTTKVLVVECARQLGKSFTLANWAVKRLMTKLADGAASWLIVVISNSKANGVEFGMKAAEAVRGLVAAEEQWQASQVTSENPDTVDGVRDPEIEGLEISDFAHRIEIRWKGQRGRILILAASPRTARGFSGDLILDEFAFHENAAAIWDAAYPMLDANPQYICRVASTHNGEGSLFNQWIKERYFPTYSITRSLAWRMGQGEPEAMQCWLEMWRQTDPASAEEWAAHHDLTPQPQDRLTLTSMRRRGEDRKPLLITPDEARAEARDKSSYDQNYENKPGGSTGALLTFEILTKAQRAPWFATDTQSWSDETLQRLYRLKGDGGKFFAGMDIGHTEDLSVITVLHETGGRRRMVAQLTMASVDQVAQYKEALRLADVLGAAFARLAIDQTGIGLGITRFLADKLSDLVLPVHFAERVPLPASLQTAGRKEKTILITELMAQDLRDAMDDSALEIITDQTLTDDLRKPGRVQTSKGVSIAAARGADGHADRFWALALALHAALSGDFGGWTPEDVAGAMIGNNPGRSLPAYQPPGMVHSHNFFLA